MEVFRKILARETSAYGRQKEVAQKAGIAENSISRYIKGTSQPALDVLDALADALGVPAWRLIKPDEPSLSPVQRDAVRLISALDDEKLSLVLPLLKQMLAPHVEKKAGKPT